MRQSPTNQAEKALRSRSCTDSLHLLSCYLLGRLFVLLLTIFGYAPVNALEGFAQPLKILFIKVRVLPLP